MIKIPNKLVTGDMHITLGTHPDGADIVSAANYINIRKIHSKERLAFRKKFNDHHKKRKGVTYLWRV